MTGNLVASSRTTSSYRWVILALCTLTPLFVVTLPNMSLPPLFATIGADLNLSLVEIGTIWGIGSFTGIFFALIGGTLGDRFGTRTTLFVVCLLTGVFGLSRSLAVDFFTLLVTSMLLGVFYSIIPVILFKVIRQWFPPQQLGMASGVISAGFASGLMLGPLLSTSLIAPALGGWRQVLIFYGIVAMVFSVLWLIVHPREAADEGAERKMISLRANLRYVMSLRNLWLLSTAALGVNACFNGFTGYLPTYLKTIGWANLDADRALSVFFLFSLLAVVPLSVMSDRFHWRWGFLIFGAAVLGLGIGSLAFVEGGLILIVVGATGIVFDGFMAIYNASVLEVEGIGFAYAGTALGFSTTIRNLGGTFSPPLGNSLAVYGPNIPFLLWGGMGLFAVVIFAYLLVSRRSRSSVTVEPQPTA
jgi:MFS transporter, CP family, cyanate transporter